MSISKNLQKNKIRTFLATFWFIHLQVFLAFLALFGYLMTKLDMLIFFIILAFAGSICSSFIRIIDTIKSNNL